MPKRTIKNALQFNNLDFMTLIEWTPKLSVGIKKIDEQHEKFIGMLNKADKLVKANKKEELTKQLPQLLNYARTHFTTEEEIFEKYSYQYGDEHKLEHLLLIEKSIVFYDRAKKGERIGKELIPFLKDWLENHLKTHDFKYRDYFKKNKIQVE